MTAVKATVTIMSSILRCIVVLLLRPSWLNHNEKEDLELELAVINHFLEIEFHFYVQWSHTSQKHDFLILRLDGPITTGKEKDHASFTLWRRDTRRVNGVLSLALKLRGLPIGSSHHGQSRDADGVVVGDLTCHFSPPRLTNG